MIRFLTTRPVAVCLSFLACCILGIVAYLHIPVSLLPDIPIPEITVQISGRNVSARELENTLVRPVRQQLQQVGNLRDIRSESRDGGAAIYLSFEYGVNTDLAFIEVNEKVDLAMNYLPREAARPQVVKASAADIPVFNLNLTLRSDSCFGQTDPNKFMELSDFAENVIRRRFEQLPAVAMVDVSGTVKKQVLITPDPLLLESSGVTLSDIETAFNHNNIDPGSMKVRDGHYEYTIRFTSVLRTIEDIQHIYLRKNDRIYQLKELAAVQFAPEKEQGMTLCNGKRSIVLSIIKQSEENIGRMQRELNEVIGQFGQDFPDIEFHITQNQTELLDYTFSNLLQNLLLAFLFVFLISAVFLKEGRSSLIIGIGLFVALVISLLFFYLFRISLNVVSLTGLILASGNMIDNSIVVTDNIGQYRRRFLSLPNACVKGTNEIAVPMLSSMLTNVSVFLPLIFMSGMAGAIFFDQAVSVTIGLGVSYLTGILLLPVLYSVVYAAAKKRPPEEPSPTTGKDSYALRLYDAGIRWVFSHKTLTLAVLVTMLPLGYVFFRILPKEKMPDIRQSELLIDIEWNENIHLQENYERCLQLSRVLEGISEENTALVGQQQFLLANEKELTSSEAGFYVRTRQAAGIPSLKEQAAAWLAATYPTALVSFSPSGTIFEKIFSTGEADLVVEHYAGRNTPESDVASFGRMEQTLAALTGEMPAGNSLQQQLNLRVDREKLLYYNIPYERVYAALQTAFRENHFALLRSQQQYLPVLLGGEEQTVDEILNHTLIETSANPDGTRNKLPLKTFVSVTPSEDLKTIVAGKAGEYVPFYYYETDRPAEIVEAVKAEAQRRPEWEMNFSGSFFSNRQMLQEMTLILLVSVLLMFFILSAQFGNFRQPLIVMFEIPVDIAASLGLLLLTGHSLNLMSAIGIVVTCGIIINDSILKIDVMNQLRREGFPLMEAIHEAGRRRLKAIVMTGLTSIVCMVPLLFTGDLGSQLEKPLAIATIGGMLVGMPVSLFVVPLVYWWVYRKEEIKNE